ncbi:MAG TPA: DUF488 family protein [Chitinophagaceae bacterium]|jgi:uncharacterized protein YeaO (DUF488 family)|nr:DUF488 family protein [Chitinophagaceae bacterium]
MPIRIKRVYLPADAGDGYRVLVDRLWPRGLSKSTLQADRWLKEVAPSDALRKWFNHDADKWPGFVKKYTDELAHNAAFSDLQQLAKMHKNITLLYAAKDEMHNQAIVLAKLLAT